MEKESDVTIISDSKIAIKNAKESFYFHRKVLEGYVKKNNHFLKSFSPVNVNTNLRIINIMSEVAEMCNVGPMASVAGALADLMLEAMLLKNDVQDFELTLCKVALVENGGEIAIDSEKTIKIALYAGKNELNFNLGFMIKKNDCPLGIGTSSASIGHAVSLGQADAVTVFAENSALADAAATRICNTVKDPDIEKSIKKGLDVANDLEGIIGTLISRGNKVGQTGKLPQLIKIENDKSIILRDKLSSYIQGDFEIFK